MNLNSMAALRAQNGSATSDFHHVLGYYEPGDGGGGDFFWNAAAVDPDNSGTIFNTGNSVGRWERLFSGPINVKWFGARGNGSNDDTIAIQRAINVLNPVPGGAVFIPAGIYMIKAHVDSISDGYSGYLGDEGGIALNDNIHLELDHNAVLKAIANTKKQYQVIRGFNKNNISISGGRIEGDRDTHTGTGGEWGYGIGITACTNVTIKDITCAKCWGDGINIQVHANSGVITYPENILVENVWCDNNRRQGMSIEGGKKSITILNSTFSNTNGTAPQCGIDIEPWDANTLVENVTITNCNFVKNKHAGILLISNAANNVKVSGCNFIDNESSESHILTTGNPKNLLVADCFFNGTTRAVQLMGASGVRIVNNIFDDCGLQLGHMTVPNPVKSVVVAGNSFYGKTGAKNISVSSEMLTSDLHIINNLFDAALLPSNNNGMIYPVADKVTFKGNTVINFQNGVLCAPDTIIDANLFHSCGTVSIWLKSGSVCTNNVIHGSGFNSSDTSLGCIHLPDAANKNIMIRNNTLYQAPKYRSAEKSTTAVAAITVHDVYQLRQSEFTGNSIINDTVSDSKMPMFYEPTFSGYNYTKSNIVTRSQHALYCTSSTNRPLEKSKGDSIFDTTLGKPVFWNGSNWIDSSGSVV